MPVFNKREIVIKDDDIYTVPHLNEDTFFKQKKALELVNKAFVRKCEFNKA